MFNTMRFYVELLGWFVVFAIIVTILLTLLDKFRYWLIRRMERHTQGVCDGVAASGMFPWVGPENMPLSGMSSAFSYAPKKGVVEFEGLNGPAVIISGIAGQYRMTGFAHAIWCEGPPTNWFGGKAKRYARLFWIPLLPIGYKAGFWIGRKVGARALAAEKPLEGAKWVPVI